MRHDAAVTSPQSPLGAAATGAAAPGLRRGLTWLVVLLAVVVPLGSVAALIPKVMASGNVSHWPWEEHGVWGWWLVPAGLWLSVVPAAARNRPARLDRLAVLLLVFAAGTTLALLYNP